MRRVFFIAASLASVLAASECIEPTQQSAFRQATMVFHGELVRVVDVDVEGPHKATSGGIELKQAESGVLAF
ncbi:MAG: hypothetical protein HYX25_08945 [Candidatus Solibacter usitatus]|nr:hypothetical protein [Candidatus Solibacter usitatus]